MSQPNQHQVFLSYSPENEAFVAKLAERLKGDARLAFWFRPWHAIPGEEIQRQMEDALLDAQSCAVFVSDPEQIKGWQNEQMRAAIQNRVEDEQNYRVIPVLLPGIERPKRRALPPFLRLYEPVEFQSADDELAFKRLLAGIIGIPPIEVDGFLQTQSRQERLGPPPAGVFAQGHALLIGIADYQHVKKLSDRVLNDVHDLKALLTDEKRCGYPAAQVIDLVDHAADRAAIRTALRALAERTKPDDTAVIFFSGHGWHHRGGDGKNQYIMPVDGDPGNLAATALDGDEMSALLHKIKAGRLLAIFNSCHSGGAAEVLGEDAGEVQLGLSEDYFAGLAQGQGRVVIASSRSAESSLVLLSMRNSLFTHYLLEALRGEGPQLGDGYIRVFDLFRHVSERVPARAELEGYMQQPILKVNVFEKDFPVALGGL